MTKPRKKERTSLFRRLLYFMVVLIGGGGAGVGGWAFQDHPLVQSLLSAVTGNPADQAGAMPEGSLVTEVVDALKPRDTFTEPGLYQVVVAKVDLDQKLFRPGHTVDIQARVRKLDRSCREVTLWDAKAFGSRLAVVGKDELSAGWPDRPFQVEWNPGDQFVLEVYDARMVLFIQPKRFKLTQDASPASGFPLKSGDFPLEPAQSSDAPVDPRTNHIVLQSQRLRDLRSSDSGPTQVAERPIVIK
jgi:hypothetical protein